MKISILKLEDINNFKFFEKYLKLISTERQKKIDNFKFDYQKIVSLFAELLIRFRIIQELKISNEDIFFEYNQFGKPSLKSYKDYNFSISHCDNCIVFISDNNAIGIDIEKIKSVNLNIAKRFFNPNEYEKIINSENPNIDFFKIWTSKESYIKMLGTGFHTSLKSFDVLNLKENFYSVLWENFWITVCSNSLKTKDISTEILPSEEIIGSFVNKL